MTRGPALVEVMRPKVEGTEMLLFGFEKFAQLKRLKNSVRNSPRNRSVSGMYFTTEKSKFFCPGPVRNFAEAKNADAALYAKFFRAMLANGVYLAPSQFEASFVSLPMSDRKIIKKVTKAADAAFAAL